MTLSVRARSWARFCLCLCVVVGVLAAVAPCSAEPDRSNWVTVRPVDNGKPLENPGMGWVFHHYDNGLTGYGNPLGPAFDGREFPGLSVVYLRLAWSHVEPAEGQFNWSILDTPIQRYGAAGKRFAFCFTVFEGDPQQGTPEWVRAAGAQGQMVAAFGTSSWEPDYDDPIFLGKLARFLSAVGARYDGHPRLAFVDVGTLGIWGEGHPLGKKYTLATLRKHIGLHKHAFPRTLLVAQDDWVQHFAAPDAASAGPLDLAREMGLAFRDNSICVFADPKLHYAADLAQPFWPSRPVVLEMGHYSDAKKVGAWGGERYLQAVEDYHASYASIHADPRTFLAENEDLVRRMNLRLGYRVNLTEVSWPPAVRRADGLTVRATWRNAGVAPCLPGGHPTWTLCNERGERCAVVCDEGFDVRTLPPAASGSDAVETRERRFPLPPLLAPGQYTLVVSVGDVAGTTCLALPLDGDNGRHGYPVGQVRVE